MTHRICYYHAGCSDGFGAAWAIHHWFGDAYDYRPLQYGAELDPAEHAGAEVLFVDVTLKADAMRELCATAWEVTVLDHHVSAIRELQPLMDAGFFGGVLDPNRSGARIAWDWAAGRDSPVRPTPAAPELIDYIEDRDLWRKALRGCDEVAFALRSYPLDIKIWGELMLNVPIDELISQGNHIRRYYDGIVDQFVKRSRLLNVADHLVPAVNCPGAFASDVGERLAAGHPFAVCYFDTADKRVFSLRSAPDGLDVSRIAEQFGGGGHRHAAGFTRELHLLGALPV